MNTLRAATVNDLDALLVLENASFDSDRLSRRNLRHLLTRGHALTLVEENKAGLQGYGMILLHRGTSLARLYSLAVDPTSRGTGVAQRVVAALESAALEQDRTEMRLEVRQDNGASLGLFRKLGYREFGQVADYYEDGMTALRLRKRLRDAARAEVPDTPYYAQTLDFTCGPAALMMAMAAQDRHALLDRQEELRLWRESTTIFMTSGHGGCGPYGLALAAYERGFKVRLVVSDDSALFVDSVRSEEKKEVIRLVQQDFIRQIKQYHIPVEYGVVDVPSLREWSDRGWRAVVLISSYRIYGEKFPHWVLVTGFDDRFVYVHDPYIDEEQGYTETDRLHMPIAHGEFARMARYGKSVQRAVILIGPRRQAQKARAQA